MKWILSLFVCLSASAQLPVIPFVLTSSAPITPSLFMPGLAEAWEWTNSSLQTNLVVTNWIGQIQGIILTNGDTGNRPTNTALGVLFKTNAVTSSLGLTNVPIPVSTNYILAFFLRPMNQNGNEQRGIFQLCGTNPPTSGSSIFQGYKFQQNGSVLRPNYVTTAGVSRSSGIDISREIMMDLVYYKSNYNSTIDILYIWTNGVNLGNISATDFTPTSMNFLGNGINVSGLATGDGWQGYINGYYIMTNPPISTSGDLIASNIHYYRTNFLMHGDSP